jgi:hypothetical protein
MSRSSAAEPTALDALRNEWGEGWHFFRARASTDAPGAAPTGDYIATLLSSGWGIHRTLMHTTPADMYRALVIQKAAADAGRSLYTLATL